jgi:hypothetical protein
MRTSLSRAPILANFTRTSLVLRIQQFGLGLDSGLKESIRPFAARTQGHPQRSEESLSLVEDFPFPSPEYLPGRLLDNRSTVSLSLQSPPSPYFLARPASVPLGNSPNTR